MSYSTKRCDMCEGSGRVLLMPDGHEVECGGCEGSGRVRDFKNRRDHVCEYRHCPRDGRPFKQKYCGKQRERFCSRTCSRRARILGPAAAA